MKGAKAEQNVLVGDTGKVARNNAKKEWQKPTLADVSGRIMAQPYIRFT